jgi:hypothetical protein
MRIKGVNECDTQQHFAHLLVYLKFISLFLVDNMLKCEQICGEMY